MKFKNIMKKLKEKIKEMIEEDRKQYTNDCFGNRVRREQLSEEEIQQLLKKIEDAEREGRL